MKTNNKFMKTKLTTLVLCLVLTSHIMAQQKTDSFFTYQDLSSSNRATLVEFYTNDGTTIPNMNVNAASLEDGFFVLSLICMLYLIARRKEATI